MGAQSSSLCTDSIRRRFAAARELQQTLQFLSRWIVNDKVSDKKCGCELIQLAEAFENGVVTGNEDIVAKVINKTILKKLKSKGQEMFVRFFDVVCNGDETKARDDVPDDQRRKCSPDLDGKNFKFTDVVLDKIPEYFTEESKFVGDFGDGLKLTIAQEFNDFVDGYHRPMYGQSIRYYYDFQEVLRELYAFVKNDLDEEARARWTSGIEPCEALRYLQRLNELTNLLLVLDDMQCRIISPSENDRNILLLSAPHIELFQNQDKDLVPMVKDIEEYLVFVRQMKETRIIPEDTPIAKWILLQRLIFQQHVGLLFDKLSVLCR